MEDGDGLVFKTSAIRQNRGLKAAKDLAPAFYAGVADRYFAVKSARVELDFSLGDGTILLDGRVLAELSLECARCGKIFPARRSESFDEAYKDTVESIDARGPALEALALAAPMKPLCSAACRGLCSVCGCDLNVKACGCGIPPAGRDENGRAGPFAALKKI